MNATVAAFLRYAASRLHPLGVRVSADVFGLSATHDLGIGQHPGQSARSSTRSTRWPTRRTTPRASTTCRTRTPRPGDGHGLAARLPRAARRRQGLIVPWLQDFSLGRTYTLADVAAQIAAARAYTGGFMLWNAAGLYTAQALHRGAPPPLPALPAPQL